MARTRSRLTCFQIDGEGPPLVLVHGLGMARAMWAPLLPALAARHLTVTYDLLGHGESRPPRAGKLALADFSAQLLELLDELGIAQAPIVGFSLGGMIVRRFALDQPQRTSAMAVLNSPHGRTPAERAAVQKRVDQAAAEGPAATIGAAIERWFTPAYREAHPQAIETIRQSVLGKDTDVYPRIYQVLVDGDDELTSAVAALRLPALVMTCADDSGNTPEMARRMAASIPGSEVDIVPGMRHMGLWEAPDRFAGVILDFLARRLDASRTQA